MKLRLKKHFQTKLEKFLRIHLEFQQMQIPGLWKINAKSGSNFDNVPKSKFLAVVTGRNRYTQWTEVTRHPRIWNKQLHYIPCFRSKKTVTMEIFADDNEIYFRTLSPPAASQSRRNQSSMDHT